MWICSDRHKEICYDCRGCPLCETLDTMNKSKEDAKIKNSALPELKDVMYGSPLEFNPFSFEEGTEIRIMEPIKS